MIVTFDLDKLTGSDRRMAEYLARLAQYRTVATEFEAEIAVDSERDIVSVTKARTLLRTAAQKLSNARGIKRS